MSNAEPGTPLPWYTPSWCPEKIFQRPAPGSDGHIVATADSAESAAYIVEACNSYPELQAKFAALTAEVARLQTKLDEQRHTADICAHVIIESDFPLNYCRCEACIEVAKRMDEAGYMEHVKDRWWEAAALSDTEPGGE